VKPVIVGPVTHLWLGKAKDESNKLELLDNLLLEYKNLLATLANNVEWVQIDEPILVTELTAEWQQALMYAFKQLRQQLKRQSEGQKSKHALKILLATYFGQLKENLPLATSLPVDGIHLDSINAQQEVVPLIKQRPADKIISLGIINGLTIWKTDLNALLSLVNASLSTAW